MNNQPTQETQKKFNIKSIFLALASLKLTVVCLLLLVILTIWGTVYQADHGLYQAQQKFFSSWFVLQFGVIPFPGTVLVMFVLFINLVFALFFRIGFRLAKIGNIVIHLGFLIMLVGGFYTFYYSEESTILIKEGTTTTLSESRTEWELALKVTNETKSDVYAMDSASFKPGETLQFKELNLQLKIQSYFRNCTPLVPNQPVPGTESTILNASGIQKIEEEPTHNIDVEEYLPGVNFQAIPSTAGTAPLQVILYGGEQQETIANIDGKEISFSLRKKRIPLPLSIQLMDFTVKMYPNSQIPKSYESKVLIKGEEEGSLEREVVISMNKPLRFKDYTFFQSGYDTRDNSEYSILAVVKNKGRLLPYFSSITIFLGLMIHFLTMLFKRRKKTGETAEPQKNEKR